MVTADPTVPKVKVLILCYDLKDGGSPRVASTILAHIQRSTFEPVLVRYCEDQAYPFPTDIVDYVLGVRSGGNLLRKLLINLIAVLRLRNVLNTERPDVVLGMGGITNWCLILANLCRIQRTPIVVGEHGAGAGRYREDRATVFVIGLLQRCLYPFAHRIVSISQGVKRYLVNELGIPEGKVVSIPNPVDIAHIRRLSQQCPDHPWLRVGEKPVILSVGRLVALKGLHHLINAFEQVLKSLEARLLIVGEGPEETRLRLLVAEKGLASQVDFLGFQENPYSYMARASIFALPSLGGEGFPMVLVEAMACGLPIVATDCVAGPSEILEGGKCGSLVPVGDERALADAIVALLTSPDLRRGLVQRANKRVTSFAAEEIVREYESLFLTLSNR